MLQISKTVVLNMREFGYKSGDIIADKYEVINFLGGGWEGEVFRIRELKTGIERAAKIFYPKRNRNNKIATNYAKKLHKLRSCSALIQYHNIERIEFDDTEVTVFVSEFVEGQLLKKHLSKYRAQVLPVYQGLHLLHALTVAVESIHKLGEYHGDLHAGNVMIEKLNIRYELKLLDLFNLGKSNKSNLQFDILCIIRLFYDVIGGQKKYSKHSPFVKSICCGLKQSLILKKFKSASHLRTYLEAHSWD